MSHYVLVTGGRDPDPLVCQEVCDVLDFLRKFYGGTLRVMHGDARGVDTVAADFCVDHGIKARGYPADWGRGKRAGLERNTKMCALLVDWARRGHTVQVIAFRGGRGTEHCASHAEHLGLPADRIPTKIDVT